MKDIVVVAVSGRALAQSAAKSGARIRVLDAFADRDTREVADAVNVAAAGAIALDPERLFAALGPPAASPQDCAIVVGSGFERHPELLERLARHGTLCANDPDIVAALKDPELSAELLRALGWEVPETRRAPPSDPRGWLQKEVGGAGGVHVRQAEGAPFSARTYYQRQLPGRPLSVTFLADGERALVLGYNAQSFRAAGNAPFCYAGAATCSVDRSVADTVQERLDRLVRVTGLRGLNGLDFLLEGGHLAALEVNPRPVATFELYEADFPEGLVHWHIRSFAGPVPSFSGRIPQRDTGARAYAIVYAEHPLQIPDNAAFPVWCRDLPIGGSSIGPGAPVVSVFAEGDSEEVAQRILQGRQAEVRRLLARWEVRSTSKTASAAGDVNDVVEGRPVGLDPRATDAVGTCGNSYP